MTEFTMATTIEAPYEDVERRVREGLAEAGFGILTEIDVQATLREKLGVEVPPQVILGACRPQLAHAALQADPRIATLLPCSVVVAREGDHTTRVEVLDPTLMASFSDAPELAAVAADARDRLAGMLVATRRPIEEDTHAAGA